MQLVEAEQGELQILVAGHVVGLVERGGDGRDEVGGRSAGERGEDRGSGGPARGGRIHRALGEDVVVEESGHGRA